MTESTNDRIDDETSIDRNFWYPDQDEDGFGAYSADFNCQAIEGYVADSSDCNDSNANQNPSMQEDCTTEIDDTVNGRSMKKKMLCL